MALRYPGARGRSSVVEHRVSNPSAAGSIPAARSVSLSDCFDTFSNMKTAEREMARRIRREEGASINEIARRTGAAKSSISRWVRDIELTKEQHESLRL